MQILKTNLQVFAINLFKIRCRLISWPYKTRFLTITSNVLKKKKNPITMDHRSSFIRLPRQVFVHEKKHKNNWQLLIIIIGVYSSYCTRSQLSLFGRCNKVPISWIVFQLPGHILLIRPSSPTILNGRVAPTFICKSCTYNTHVKRTKGHPLRGNGTH